MSNEVVVTFSLSGLNCYSVRATSEMTYEQVFKLVSKFFPKRSYEFRSSDGNLITPDMKPNDVEEYYISLIPS